MSHVDDGTLHAYLDGELSAMEAVRLEKHTTDCPACRDRLGEARALIRHAGQLLDAATPPVRAAPPFDELREPRLAWRIRVPLAWAATVMLALGAGWYFGVAPHGRAPAARETALGEHGRAAPDTAKAIVIATRSQPVVPAPAAAELPSTPLQPQQKVEAQVQGAVRDEDRAIAMRERAADSLAVAKPTAEPAPPAANIAPQAGVTARMVGGRPVATDVASAWGPVSADSARALLGTDPVAIPGVPVRRIRASALGDRVVLVEQPLDSATVVYLYERRESSQIAAESAGRRDRVAAPAPSALAASKSAELLARYVGSLRVEITAALPVDSLSKLLESLSPIR